MHAQVLNRVVDEIQYDVSLGSVADLELKEVLGHTPRQVGALQLNLYPNRAGRGWFQGRRRRHDCTRACRGICCAGWDRSDGRTSMRHCVMGGGWKQRLQPLL